VKINNLKPVSPYISQNNLNPKD